MGIRVVTKVLGGCEKWDGECEKREDERIRTVRQWETDTQWGLVRQWGALRVLLEACEDHYGGFENCDGGCDITRL